MGGDKRKVWTEWRGEGERVERTVAEAVGQKEAAGIRGTTCGVIRPQDK